MTRLPPPKNLKTYQNYSHSLSMTDGDTKFKLNYTVFEINLNSKNKKVN